MDSKTPLSTYLELISKDTMQFLCPLCQSQVSINFYENHCKTDHQLNAELCYIWCLGHKTWEKGSRAFHVDHLKHCYQTFVSENFNATLNKDNTFGYTKLPGLPDRVYEPLWTLELPPMTLYADESLNEVAAYVKKYLEKSGDWFHVMVRGIAMPHFLQAMDDDQGQSRTLPYWCWCDGGEETEALYRQHRHMIVVSTPKGQFKKMYDKVKIDHKPYEEYKCIECKEICSVFELVEVMQSLSGRESGCNFTFDL